MACEVSPVAMFSFCLNFPQLLSNMKFPKVPTKMLFWEQNRTKPNTFNVWKCSVTRYIMTIKDDQFCHTYMYLHISKKNAACVGCNSKSNTFAPL